MPSASATDRGHSRSRPMRPRQVPALPARVQAVYTDGLLHGSHVTPGGLRSALQHASQTGTALYQAVVALGFVEERTSYRLLAEAAGMEFVEPSAMMPGPLVLHLVPQRLARLHDLLPLRISDCSITYVTARPYDADADRDVGVTTGRTPVMALACPTDLRASLDRLYPNEADIAELLADARSATVVEPVDLDEPAGTATSAIAELCNSLVARGIDAGAGDLHFDPSRAGLLVRMRVRGVLEPVITVPPDSAVQVRNRFKVMARADVAIRHRPQDGAFAVRVSGRRIDVRLSTLPTVFGEKLVMRLLDSQGELQVPDALGYDAALLTRLRRVLDRPAGLFLATGPTGSGKTTALYAALHHLRGGRVNVVSVEDPVERTIAGVNQIPVNNKAGATYAAVLRSVLRQDPDVLMVGEIRDAEVAAIVGEAALTGHLVLSSVHTIDAATAVTRLLTLGLEPCRVAESLTGILAQRLLRRLCPGCRRPEGAVAALGEGCPQCGGTGFLDRIPVAELLTPTDEIRQVIARGATAGEVRQAMRAAGMPTMRDAARALVTMGATSPDEVGRVLGADESDDAPSVPRCPVLIADDEPIMRTLVRVLLERDGYQVIEAKTGREAAALAGQHHPELIVMDLNMPQMDGYGAIAAIRATPALAATPIVVVTGEESPQVERQVLALGADDYIVKPFEPAVLSARVKAAFGRQRFAA